MAFLSLAVLALYAAVMTALAMGAFKRSTLK
jgi:hypothetical protein